MDMEPMSNRHFAPFPLRAFSLRLDGLGFALDILKHVLHALARAARVSAYAAVRAATIAVHAVPGRQETLHVHNVHHFVHTSVFRKRGGLRRRYRVPARPAVCISFICRSTARSQRMTINNASCPGKPAVFSLRRPRTCPQRKRPLSPKRRQRPVLRGCAALTCRRKAPSRWRT